MKFAKTALGLSMALGVSLCASTQVFAQSSDFGDQQTSIMNLSDAGFQTVDYSSLSTEQKVALEEAKLSQARQAYPQHFADAYAQYPSIPKGVLEAIAFVQSRWVNLQPTAYTAPHQHMPQAHGVMGLYHGQGFRDQVQEAALLLGVDAEQVLKDEQTNILAAAALLDQLIQQQGKAPADAESMVSVIADYAGFVTDRSSEIQSYARDNFTYDVLLSIDRGVDDNGIFVPEQAIEWERAFDQQRLVELKAPFVRLDAQNDRVLIDNYEIDPISETLRELPQANEAGESNKQEGFEEATSEDTRSIDYGPALYVQSPYHGTRSQSISAVTIHTMQGSYAGSISWFQNNPFSVSAHYMIRSSDGQITQMVRESRRAHHVGVHNSATLGIEHEGFVESGSSWYTTAMYNASAALTRHFCARYSPISCATAYNGPGHSGVNVLSTSIDIKGHQHFSSNTHVDPGVFWDWPRYYGLLNGTSGGGGGGSGGSTTILDSFESSEGHFNTSPAYSGSTVGISSSSTAVRTCSLSRNGNCSEQIRLVDNSSSSSNWAVRFLSGSGRPSSNTRMGRNGRVGMWVYSGGSGMSVAVGLDDSDGTERSDLRSIPADRWTFVEWRINDSSQWNSWVGGNGSINASTVTMDAVWFFRNQTSFNVFVYIDDVQYIAD